MGKSRAEMLSQSGKLRQKEKGQMGTSQALPWWTSRPSLVRASVCTLAAQWGRIFPPGRVTAAEGDLVPLSSFPPRAHGSNLPCTQSQARVLALWVCPRGTATQRLAADLELAQTAHHGGEFQPGHL